MFVPKAQRATIAEAERLAAEAARRAELAVAKKAERAKEAQQQVAAVVQSELEAEHAAKNPETVDAAGQMPDDSDDVGAAEECVPCAPRANSGAHPA